MNLNRSSLRRARPAAAALAIVLAAPLAAACQPLTPAPTPGTPAPATPTTETGPVVTAPTGPAPTGPVTVPPTIPPPASQPGQGSATTTTSTTRSSTPTTGTFKPVLALRTDGLAPARFGEDIATTVGKVNGFLGAPDDPGFAGGGFGACGVTSSQFVRWGDLQLMFTAHGGGLKFSGFWLGETFTLPGSPGHAAPVGPGDPKIANPWGVDIGTAVPSADGLVRQTQTLFPDSRLLRDINAGDSAVSMSMTGSNKLVIGLHPAGGGTFLVEHLRAFDSADLFC